MLIPIVFHLKIVRLNKGCLFGRTEKEICPTFAVLRFQDDEHMDSWITTA